MSPLLAPVWLLDLDPDLLLCLSVVSRRVYPLAVAVLCKPRPTLAYKTISFLSFFFPFKDHFFLMCSQAAGFG